MFREFLQNLPLTHCKAVIRHQLNPINLKNVKWLIDALKKVKTMSVNKVWQLANYWYKWNTNPIHSVPILWQFPDKSIKKIKTVIWLIGTDNVIQMIVVHFTSLYNLMIDYPFFWQKWYNLEIIFFFILEYFLIEQIFFVVNATLLIYCNCSIIVKLFCKQLFLWFVWVRPFFVCMVIELDIIDMCGEKTYYVWIYGGLSFSLKISQKKFKLDSQKSFILSLFWKYFKSSCDPSFIRFKI